ncbi:MAG TPA: NmrA family NAD(P)-binding protein [Bacteroidales bacterium]
MKRILITGATGNIGFELIRFLFEIKLNHQVIAGVRNIEKAKKVFQSFPELDFVEFDFEKAETFSEAFENVDILFLLRPPHISEIEKYFHPLINQAVKKGIRKIMFLSVQGVEKSNVIPHHKIEQLIVDSGVDYIFLRPSYFMQNLTTTLLHDIVEKRQIILPAGKAKFNWVDVENIAEVVALLMDNFENYKNEAIELTGDKNEDFYAAANYLTMIIGEKITYRNVNPLRFYFIKKKSGMPAGKILVMILLHFLPRFQKEPRISDFYKQLTGKQATTLKEFIEREKGRF